jgi:hypothetical protein
MLDIAYKIQPHDVCLVPEKREEVTTEGGLDVVGYYEVVKAATKQLQEVGIRVSLFIDPEEKQIQAAKDVGATVVELHTGRYADLSGADQTTELERIRKAAQFGKSIGLRVNAGHGLHESNVMSIAAIAELSELNIGHAIVAEALFKGWQKAIADMKALGAVIVDPLVVPDFSALRKDQWCSNFKTDIETYLVTQVKNDTIKTLDDIIRIGTKSKFAADRLKGNKNGDGQCQDASDVYTAQKRIAYRKAIENQMDKLKLDAIVYPTWNNRPAEIATADKDYKGDNSQIIAPHTGQPAFTVPMGFSEGNLPAGIQFLGRMYAESTLIRLAYGYEQGTKHRVPPVLK